jgi:hypothetical protein
MKNIFCILFFFFFPAAVMAQVTCSGRVVEAGTTKPIVSASVFIGSSSAGTTTDEAGNYILRKVPAGKFTLVVSSVGYETFARQMESGKIPAQLTVELTHKTAALEEVVVTAAEKNGWITWGDLFLENFIGKTTYARECRITNPKVLRFRNSVKNNTLKVWSDEPLIIENNALGYTLSYDLHEFMYNFSDNSVAYSGYPLFTDMPGKDKKAMAKIKESRKRVYAISLLHFTRSLYTNRTAEEGFRIVRTIGKAPVDLRRKPVPINAYDGVEKYDTIYEINNRETLVKIVPMQNNLATNNNQADDDPSSIGNIITGLEADSRSLYFTDTLQVVYTKAKTPYEYQQYETNNRGTVLSGISLVQNRPVTLFANGSYFAGSNLSLSGFWGWWEKIGIMLPYDYEPEETKTSAGN